MRFYCNCLSVWLKLVLITRLSHAFAFHFLQAKWPKRMLRQMNGPKEAKRKKKNEGWTREGSFGFHSLPYLSIFSLHLFPSFCLLPYRVLSPRILEENRNTAPRGREGGAHGGVHFLLESNSPFEINGFHRPGAELICALYRDCFLCKCYSSFSVLADLKTHFKITERTWVLMRETVPGSRLRKMPILYLLKILPNEISNWTTRSVWFIT